MDDVKRQLIIDTMKAREFSFNMESRDGKGKTIAYHFLANPVYHRRHKDKIITPAFGCTVYPDTNEFQFTYVVPKSINKLESPKCGSFENEDHFYRICNKFESAVRVLHSAFGDE